MNFKFNISLSDKDYLDYNKFWMLDSPYGKSQMIKSRIAIAIIIGLIALFRLFKGDFSANAFIGIIPYLVLFVIFQLALKPFLVLGLKEQVKSLKKKGKAGYSPVSTIEFYEDGFTETTPDNKMEQKYSSVERISVLNDKAIYIHINSIMAFIIPMTCFESKDQYESFMEFIKARCDNIDIY